MTLFLNPLFWLAVLLIGRVIRTTANPEKKAWTLAILNLLMLGVFLGALEVAFLLALTTILYFTAQYSKQSAKIPLAILTLFILSFLGYKISLFMADKSPLKPLLIIPYSYIFLRVIDAINVLKNPKQQTTPLTFAHLLAYLMPINMHFAGPIASFADCTKIFYEKEPKQNLTSRLETLHVIASGFFYKFFCAEVIRTLYFGTGVMMSKNLQDTGVILIYTFFDFAGYSLLAIGAGKLMGMYTPENFRAPFAAPSVANFYTRWHMSLADWVKRNIYFPLQMQFARSQRRSNRQLLFFNAVALFVSFCFIGFWHGIHYNFLIWGSSLGLIIALEKFAFDYIKRNHFDKNPKLMLCWRFLGPVYTFVMVTVAIHPAINLMVGIK